MGLKISELNRKKRAARKQNNGLREKRRANAVKTELYEKLKILEEVDRVEIEVAENVASVFMDILMNDVEFLYEYEQVDNTHFIFSNKEVDL